MSTTIRIHSTPTQPFISLPIVINGKGPFAFVLDTGAGMSILTQELADCVGVKDVESKEAIGVGGRTTVLVGKVSSIALGEFRVEDIQVAVMRELPRCIGQGVIGYNVLKEYMLTIDYTHGILTLDVPDGKRSNERVLTASVPLRLAGPDRPIIVLDAVVNNQKTYQFILDTGASQTVVSPALAREAGIGGTEKDVIVGAAGSAQGSVGRLKSLSIGSASLGNVPVIVSDVFSALNQVTGAVLDGILGFGFLSGFRVVIDYPGGILRLEEP